MNLPFAVTQIIVLNLKVREFETWIISEYVKWK